jgi:hypothetical protein
MSSASFLSCLAAVIASQPSPNYALVVRVLLCRGMEAATAIVRALGLAGQQQATSSAPEITREACGGLLCTKRCIAKAECNWMQVKQKQKQS